MTSTQEPTATERACALVRAGALLADLQNDDRVPRDVRLAAAAAAKHYPTLDELRASALGWPLYIAGADLRAMREAVAPACAWPG